MIRNNTVKSILSKLAENASVQIINFIIGIVLARILSPSDYGIYSVLVILMTICQTLVVGGLSSALVQREDITEDDYSSVFTLSLILSGVLYAVMFFFAPLLAKIYDLPEMITPLRVIAIVLIPDALYSVVNARVSRNMEFSIVAPISICSTILVGAISIVLALQSMGIWSLVLQQILIYSVFPICYCSKYKWVPKLFIDWSRFRILIGFGSKVLATNLVNSLYANMQGLIIGIKYNIDNLAYYNKGQMFPRTIMQTVSGSVETVYFPVLASYQKDREKMAEVMLKNLSHITFFVYPAMVGLFAVSREVVVLLLTEKWIDSTVIIMMFCMAYFFWPIDSMIQQAIKACGEGTVFFKFGVAKKVSATIILAVFVLCAPSVNMFALSAVAICFSDSLIGYVAIKYTTGICLCEIVSVLWKNILCSMTILVIIIIPEIGNSILLTLCIKIIIGILVYFISSLTINRPKLKDMVDLWRKR